jgi:hypothetical protein
MEEYNVIAKGGHITPRFPESTTTDDQRGERVIPPLVAMIFPTT